ncbi:MAG: hypothetical protein NVSMB25_10440 [Thermoleophilaceae bacterium]
MRRSPAALAASLLCLVALCWPAPAAAHGLVGRADLPIPSWLFGWAAAIVLAVSFVALSALWREPRLEQVAERRQFRLPLLLEAACGTLGVAVFGAVVYAGFAGTSTPTANLAPNVVYVEFWVGIAVASVLFGDVFRAFNPWRAVGRAVGWTLARLGRRATHRTYPARLGRWPAVAGIAAFAWLELVYVDKSKPSTLALLALAYAAIQLAAMARYGVSAWSDRGDAFGVYFNLFARLSIFAVRDRVLFLRKPLAGAAGWSSEAGNVALLCVAIGSTTFDGLSNGPVWASLGPDIQSAARGLGSSAAMEVANTVGLAGSIGVAAALYGVGVRGMRTVGEGAETRGLARRFVHTLIPIAFAYALAHYFSLLAFNGQAIGFLISDPLGDGSDLFGTAKQGIDYNLISGAGIWYVQVAALVSGHVAGLVLAHDRALAIYGRARDATRSQYWMLVVMVGFTSLGLWLLSAVNS